MTQIPTIAHAGAMIWSPSVYLRAVTAAALVTCGAVSANAQDCKPDFVAAAGDPFVSRSLGAYPSSLFAWRKAVEQRFGKPFMAWSAAADRKITCEQVTVESAKRWVCTRSARPCGGGGASGEEKVVFSGKLQRGDKGEEVRKLQELLVGRGAKITVDGDFGRGTERAVRDFQKTEGLTVDGVAGRQTQERLLG